MTQVLIERRRIGSREDLIRSGSRKGNSQQEDFDG